MGVIRELRYLLDGRYGVVEYSVVAQMVTTAQLLRGKGDGFVTES
jgi:hypothetical protein